MSAFADTSFLFAFYFPRADSEKAILKTQSLPAPALISSLVHYEFYQAVWFEVWRRAQGKREALNQTDAQIGLAAFDLDLEEGVWNSIQPDWERVIVGAKGLTLSHTRNCGARPLDILHVATAQLLNATEFLTFDKVQCRIADAEGLAVSP